MRVALDMQAARVERTGIGQYATELAAALAQLPAVEVVPIDWGQDPVMRIPRRIQWQQWELPRRAREQQVDLLHVTGFDGPIRHALPTVLTVHDLIGPLFPHNLPPVARWYWARWLPWTVQRARRIIADSRWTQRDIQRLLGIPAERITVVPLAADRRFAPQPEPVVAELRGRLELPTRMVLYVGTLEPRKGVDTLLKAWGQIAATVPDVELVIAGKRGWYTEQLETQVAALGLQRRVRWLGYVSHADLPALYAAAEVFVFPSRYEGFGLPPLEAMACGTPIISSDASALPEVVGDAGLLHAADDAVALARLLRLTLTQPTLQAALRTRGLARAGLFSWRHTAEQTLAVYREVLDQAAEPEGRS